MNRHYLLDTNIVMFFFLNPKDLIRKIQNILEDCNNTFYVSTTSVKERLNLFLRCYEIFIHAFVNKKKFM
jgi:PIN domain nuclease of toxin-antitoxin system